MNILIPHTWLLESLETDADPQTIQKLVSLSGPSIERIYEREGESVYDIEVTTNRVDSMSVRGIAREAAVILQQAGIASTLQPLTLPPPAPTANLQLPLPTIRGDERFCRRMMCVVLADVQHTPTPDWMAKRLRQIEQNVHDSVIDITNYITHELGHPCHAFDYDKIMKLGGEIIVKEAAAGKTFVTLDNAVYETKGGEIVFENRAGEIIDLPAIKGTANTAVDDSTANVLFWIESLDSQKVRAASMSHAIRTVAAQLNEKHVDPYLAELTLLRGIELYQALCSAKVASAVYDQFANRPTPETIGVSFEKIATYLGLTLPTQQIATILTALEFQVRVAGDQLYVNPPTFRTDVQLDVDVIEEIARIYGYHQLPSVLMSTPIPIRRQAGVEFVLEERVKRWLAASGAQELLTYSLVDEALALADGFSLEDHLKVANPLSDEQVYLRRSLAPSLAQALTTMSHAVGAVFELANVYHPQANQLPDEALHLTLVGRGAYRSLRSLLESLLGMLHISAVTVDTAGTLTGQSNRGVTTRLGTARQLSAGMAAFDLLWQNILAAASPIPTYRPLPKAAPLTEDLTFTLPEGTAIGPLIQTMRAVSPLIEHITLGAQYQQNYTFTITYLDPSQPISTEIVAPIRSAIVARVVTAAQAKLVGTLQ